MKNKENEQLCCYCDLCETGKGLHHDLKCSCEKYKHSLAITLQEGQAIILDGEGYVIKRKKLVNRVMFGLRQFQFDERYS